MLSTAHACTTDTEGGMRDTTGAMGNRSANGCPERNHDVGGRGQEDGKRGTGRGGGPEQKVVWRGEGKGGVVQLESLRCDHISDDDMRNHQIPIRIVSA